MNFIEELGTMALGSRVKNLSEMLMKDVSRIYKEMDLDFEPRWFTFFQLVLRNPGITVTEIARELNQTHPAAVQVINSLEKKKLVRTKKDKTDQRKRLVSLTKKGKDLSEELEAVWEAVHQSAREILDALEGDIRCDRFFLSADVTPKERLQSIEEIKKSIEPCDELSQLIAFIASSKRGILK